MRRVDIGILLSDAVEFCLNGTFSVGGSNSVTGEGRVSVSGESVEWQTPEISGTVSGGAVTGSLPWRKVYDFPSQEACMAFIENFFGA